MAFERRVGSDQRRGTGGVAVHEVAPVQMFSTVDRTMVPPQPATAEARGASGFRQCPAAMAQILFSPIWAATIYATAPVTTPCTAASNKISFISPTVAAGM